MSRFFERYEAETSRFFDEVISKEGIARPHYDKLLHRFGQFSIDDIKARREIVNIFFRNQGITFTVYGEEEGVERIFPFDLIPRVVAAHEWQAIEKGLVQRITALNEFLYDIYHTQKILKDKIIPPELILGSQHFRREFVGVNPPLGIYIHVTGSDIIRDGDGNYLVLEDNLRTPAASPACGKRRAKSRKPVTRWSRSAASRRSNIVTCSAAWTIGFWTWAVPLTLSMP